MSTPWSMTQLIESAWCLIGCPMQVSLLSKANYGDWYVQAVSEINIRPYTPTFTTSFTNPTFWSMLQDQLSLTPTTFFLQVWTAINKLLHPLIQQELDKVYPDAYFLLAGIHISEKCISLLQGQHSWRVHWGFDYWHVIVSMTWLGYRVSWISFHNLTFYHCL